MSRRGYDLKIARAKLRRSKLWCSAMGVGVAASVAIGTSLALQGEGLWCLCAIPTALGCMTQFAAWAQRVTADACDVRELETGQWRP